MGELTPPLGGTRPLMDLGCGRLTSGGHCGKPSVRHVLWTADMENGVMCEEHWAEAQREWVFVDSHPVETFCTMPESEWLFSHDYPPGCCAIPISDGMAAEVLEAQLRQAVEATG